MHEWIFNIIDSLAQANKPLARGIYNVMQEVLHNDAVIDSYTSGVAVVLGLFHQYSNLELIDRFAKLSPADSQELQEYFKNLLLKSKQDTIFGSVLESPEIPETQPNVQLALDRVCDVIIFPASVRRGGAAMFRTLEHIWPKLYPASPIPPQALPPSPNP